MNIHYFCHSGLPNMKCYCSNELKFHFKPISDWLKMLLGLLDITALNM